jgi:tRNA (guanosine-2'-O-)-methyltransferase
MKKYLMISHLSPCCRGKTINSRVRPDANSFYYFASANKNRQPSTVNRKPSTVNRQPSTANKIVMTPEREVRLKQVLDKRQNDLTVVLENVFDPHNISAVMRTCDAVGIQDLYVLNTKISKHKKWGARSSSSAAKWLTVHQYTEASLCFSELRKKYPLILTTHLASSAISLYNIDFTGPVALVFGNEHDGVSEEIRALAHGNFVIPQVGMIRSLNISVACAISLYEAFRQKNAARHYDQVKMEESEYKSLWKEWERSDR